MAPIDDQDNFEPVSLAVWKTISIEFSTLNKKYYFKTRIKFLLKI